MAAIIGAIGLTILTGVTGQLSLAHAFFLAVGAYGYCYFAGHKGLGVEAAAGLGLPPLLAMVLAVLLAGLCGALFSPISGRLRGIYLGIASIGLVFVVVAYFFARNVVRGRPGRALETVRDNEVAAAVMGVNVSRYKAAAFTLSSMYAGLAGVLFALFFERVVPDTFDFGLSIDYLVMIVLCGLDSVSGAVLGAIFVSVLPQLLDHYSGSLPLVAD